MRLPNSVLMCFSLLGLFSLNLYDVVTGISIHGINNTNQAKKLSLGVPLIVMFLKRSKKVFAYTIFQLFGLFLVNM